MKLLLDQGLPWRAAPLLVNAGIECVHVSTVGLSESSDEDILLYAAVNNLVVVTLDADFHALLARSGALGPSVIRIRIEGLRAPELASLLADVLAKCSVYWNHGAAITLQQNRIALHRLPIGSVGDGSLD